MSRRHWLIIPLALFLAACQDSPDTGPTSPAAPQMATTETSVFGPALEEALAEAAAGDSLEVIVNFDDALTTSDAVTDALLALGAGVIEFRHLSMVASLATVEQILAMQTLAGLQSIYLNRELGYLNAEGRGSINADAVHDMGITGKGVGIAILDTGIDGAHPDVAFGSKTVQNVKHIANVRDAYYFEGKINGTIRKGADLYVEDVENSETSVGHGTHVAGTAAGSGEASDGKYTGVAPGAHLVGLGAGDILFVFWILSGFDYIIDHQQEYNIQVVNNSWGSSGMFDPEDPINEATREVYDAGVTVVFAAGNCGEGDPTGLDCPEPDENKVNPYSAAPWVISVAAACKLGDDPTSSTDHCADGRDQILADFSSRGLPGDELHHPDVLAPGVHIVSVRASTGTVMNGLDSNHDARICAIEVEHQVYYTCASGTSMAAPHVAGVVALLEEASGGTLTPDEALELLTQTARPYDGYELWEIGHGYVDALAAVKAAMR